MKNSIMAILLAVGLVGCASSPYTYKVDPTPLVAGQSKYALGEIEVNLTEIGSATYEGESPYATQTELTQEFVDSLKNHLQEKGIKATSPDTADAKINVTIVFKRTFTITGGLGKPSISHSINLKKDDTILATSSRRPYQTKYAYFKDAAVNLEIIAGNWDEEDEPKDVDLVSSLIVDEIMEVGK
ncbi:hypothetical protein L3V77_17410 [Vibrio sp. DW001]|uniref:hypothetical protein n=1 Tax=Vibrio sp. DW001 TaxID=2912315 RepID=UPI0023AE785E|nr:hypothetical protein [Vibrio sp. DW001]WED29210.1 hypothetical protein L3V77_17410 [Vibrio sp. DW001]